MEQCRYRDKYSSFWVNNLRSRIEYAVDKALDEDKPYFKKFIEMMDAYDTVLVEDNKLKPLVRKRKDLEYKKDHIVIDFDPDYDRNRTDYYAKEAVIKSIEDIEKQMCSIRAKKSDCLDEVIDVCAQIQAMDKKRLTGKI